jgi:hypothetical protein
VVCAKKINAVCCLEHLDLFLTSLWFVFSAQTTTYIFLRRFFVYSYNTYSCSFSKNFRFFYSFLFFDFFIQPWAVAELGDQQGPRPPLTGRKFSTTLDHLRKNMCGWLKYLYDVHLSNMLFDFSSHFLATSCMLHDACAFLLPIVSLRVSSIYCSKHPSTTKPTEPPQLISSPF